MAKLTLTQKPTFTASVQIPVLGGGKEAVQFTFKAKRKTEFADWLKSLDDKKAAAKRTDEGVLLEIVDGWELAEDFNADNLKELEQVYPGASIAIVGTYIGEYTGAKAGN